MDFSVVELLLFVIVVLLFYKFLRRNDLFFERQGVKYVQPKVFFGNMFGLFTGSENGFTVFQNVYEKFKDERAFGFFMLLRPVLFVRDVELLKKITVKDFDLFVNRDRAITKGSDGLFAKTVLFLEDNSWREMRNILTPIFTSAKLKTLYHNLASCSKDLLEIFDETYETTGSLVLEVKDAFSRYSAESISTTALGFKGNCIKDENSEIYQLALQIQDDVTSISGSVKMNLIIPNFPKLSKMLNIKIFRKSTHDFFKKYVTNEIARRESQGNYKANDVIQSLIHAKNSHSVEKKFTDWSDDELVAAQVFIFFGAGFETTSTLMQMCSWELAMNPNIQKELIEEIDAAMTNADGEFITYEALNKMKFLDMVVNETLRKWPPIPMSQRECNMDYKFVNSDGQTVEIRNGDSLMIPIRLIHHDPQYFKNPDKFDPYRFSDENKQNIIPGSFLAFGFGPRLCIGSRLALLETKLLFFTILSKYTIKTCSQTPMEITYSQSPISFKQNVFVELKPRH